MHQFITRRTERIGELHSQLHSILGADAIALIATQLDRVTGGDQTIEGEKEDW
jgi:hypothetical protein